MKYVVFDITNILYRTFFVHKGDATETIAGLAHHSALITLNKYFRQLKPNKIIMCFDRPSWRKEYTKSDECVSKKLYKGNRRQKMTPKEKEKYAQFMDHLETFEKMIREHTSIASLAAPGLEADDLVAGCVQYLTLDDDNEVVIVSSDKDMMQLLGHPNVTIINPMNGKERTLDEWEGDVDLFMFEKCLRGDTSDNVQSAYPHIKKTRIKKAYTDSYERANVMHMTWKHADGREMIVKNLFEENKKLMDLTCQPDDIQELNIRTVVTGVKNPGTFSYFHFMKFLGEYELKKIIDQAENFVDMLSR